MGNVNYHCVRKGVRRPRLSERLSPRSWVGPVSESWGLGNNSTPCNPSSTFLTFRPAATKTCFQTHHPDPDNPMPNATHADLYTHTHTHTPLPTTPSARRHHPPALQNKIQVQTIEAGCLLTRNGRRLSGWAKSALEADPNIVLTLSSLPTDVSVLQKVCAVTLVVPHTCGTKSEPRALDCEVKATDDETQSCSTVPSSASAMFPSARKGMTGPQIAAVLASKFDQGGKRCATPPLSRSPRGAHDIPRYFLERLLAQPLNQHISVTTSSCTRGYPRGATHPIRHLRVVSDGKAPSVMSVGSLERGGGKWPMHSRAGCSLRV